jgi:hypothetical protein
VGMYLDGLPAGQDTLRSLEAAFMQRKDRWRDFAVASVLQLFAERNFRSPKFEKEAVEWFEIRIAKKEFMRPALIGSLSQTWQLWLVHGNKDFPKYSAELQCTIRNLHQVRCYRITSE